MIPRWEHKKWNKLANEEMQMINIFVIYTFIYFQKQSVLIANFFLKKKQKGSFGWNYIGTKWRSQM